MRKWNVEVMIGADIVILYAIVLPLFIEHVVWRVFACVCVCCSGGRWTSVQVFARTQPPFTAMKVQSGNFAAVIVCTLVVVSVDVEVLAACKLSSSVGNSLPTHRWAVLYEKATKIFKFLQFHLLMHICTYVLMHLCIYVQTMQSNRMSVRMAARPFPQPRMWRWNVFKWGWGWYLHPPTSTAVKLKPTKCTNGGVQNYPMVWMTAGLIDR